jgi:transcriptional regulator with XRE-family HTH domain
VQAKKTEELQNFAARLKSAMEREKRLKLREVAKACDVSVSTVGSWTQGKNWPAVEKQRLLANLLKVSVQFLIHGAPDTDTVEVITDKPSDSSLAMVQHEQAPYGTGTMLRNEIREQVEQTITMAGDDVGRLSWLREQVLRHATTPDHWNVGKKGVGQEKKALRDEPVRVNLPSQQVQYPNPSRRSQSA